MSKEQQRISKRKEARRKQRKDLLGVLPPKPTVSFLETGKILGMGRYFRGLVKKYLATNSGEDRKVLEDNRPLAYLS